MAYSTINKSTDHFNTKLYTGTGSSNSITGVGFQPDWVWIKDRSSGYENNLFDSIRGATKHLYSDSSAAEGTHTGTLTSFDSDGFSLGSASQTNLSSDNFVSWNWLASNTTASNTDGTITSTVSANTTAGFSIVSYTGTGANATVGHGLGVAPSLIILKNRDDTSGWRVGHESLGFTKYLVLDSTSASATQTNIWNDTSPTSSVFTVGSGSSVNDNAEDYIAYCFVNKTGYSKFGSYTGNNNADGPFIYTGFKPSFIMLKKSNGNAQSWYIYDSKRLGINSDNNTYANKVLNPNSTNSEASAGTFKFDILSNGFKIRESGDQTNGNGNTYIYMAFAEAPLVGSNNVPCTAR